MTDEKRRWQPKNEKPKRSSGRRFGERKIIAYNADTESSKKWLERQLSDPYVQAARKEGYRSRSAYKLLEMDKETRLLAGRKSVVDLGCAPGGWLQVLAGKNIPSVVGVDLLHTDRVEGTQIFLGDAQDEELQVQMLKALTARPDLILSDMAANTTGHRQTDHLRTLNLAELAYSFAETHLAENGHFVSKVFQGGASSALLLQLKANFRSVRHVKPAASRAASPEIYVVAKGFKGR